MAAPGYNMPFRKNWSFEIDLTAGRSMDVEVLSNSREASLSSWFNLSPVWEGKLYGGCARTCNFAQDYLALVAGQAAKSTGRRPESSVWGVRPISLSREIRRGLWRRSPSTRTPISHGPRSTT